MHVIVVGAGIIGLSIADALAARGIAVRVIDMRSPGRGASQASAGMLAPYTEAQDHPDLLALGVRSLALFDGWIDGLRASTGARIEYARTGTLEVALDAAEADALRAAQGRLAVEKVPADYLDATALRALEPLVSEHATAGLMIHGHGYVGVEGLMQALVRRARLQGVVFETPVEGVGIENRRTVVELRVGERRDSADFVVVAGGSWSGRVRVANLPAIPVRPIRGQLLHLGWNAPRALARIVWGTRAYLVPWSDGTLLVGATVEDAGFDEHTTAAGVRDLTTAVIELLPEARGARLESVRVGLRPKLPDHLPAVGSCAGAPRVVMATGHYRNGILLAPLTAEIVAKYIADGKKDEALDRMAPDRFGL